MIKFFFLPSERGERLSFMEARRQNHMAKKYWKLQTHDTTSDIEAQATKEQQIIRHLASPKYIV